MSYFAEDHWVWDFWIADDGVNYHLYFLNAPKSLRDPHLRHRNATIGHAIGHDLRTWIYQGTVLAPGDLGEYDETATWTGSVAKGDDGRWRMFYTGSRFLDPVRHVNIETIGVAVSDDLSTWQKQPGPVLTVDGRWYEKLADGTWHEEAWRDPWVTRKRDGWQMHLTARARPTASDLDPRDTGVVGVAYSDDLVHWTPAPPLSTAGAGFAHLEVLQPFEWNGTSFVLFSCDAAHLAGDRRARGERGGVWVAPVVDGRFEIHDARLLVDERLYAGRIVHDRAGVAHFMGFVNSSRTGDFEGTISDPIPLMTGDDGWPALEGAAACAAVEVAL